MQHSYDDPNETDNEPYQRRDRIQLHDATSESPTGDVLLLAFVSRNWHDVQNLTN